MKEKDEELKIKKSAVLEAAKDCDEFKNIAKKLWPKVFEVEHCCNALDIAIRLDSIDYCPEDAHPYKLKSQFFTHCPFCGKPIIAITK